MPLNMGKNRPGYNFNQTSRVFTFRLPITVAEIADRTLDVGILCQETVIESLEKTLPKTKAAMVRKHFAEWEEKTKKYKRWRK